MEKIGLLAGVGKLPVECARTAKQLGYEVYAVGLLPESDPQIADFATDYQQISVGQLDAILKYLKSKDLQKVTMIGKVTKELLFNGKIQPDQKMIELIMSLPDRSDNTIMMMFVRELAKAGLQAFDQTALIRRLMPRRGTITNREPSTAERQDMDFGFRIAKELGRFDVGQTVVVKNRAVMALEAIEGTDECIRRGGKLANGGAVVAKVSKPNQDNRFDVPTVGKRTVEVMAEVGATALAIEADKTLLVDRENTVDFADEKGITIVAI
ncbi:MAG: UDP-2,3-diacylglucosamine diphosphatase LpxI [Selenomonadaceae bacterium]|nr:UDP-2,3-diacylglucosamine diphosphatase LpxI [Selenomonadaceae bacterium]